MPFCACGNRVPITGQRCFRCQTTPCHVADAPLATSSHPPRVGGRVLTLWGSPISTYCRFVEHVAHTLDYDVEYIDTMPFGEGKALLESLGTPLAQIPTVRVDGMTLYESGAIARYLASGTELYPTHDRRSQVLVDEGCGLAAAVTAATYPIFRRSHPGALTLTGEKPADPEEKATLANALTTILRKLEFSGVFTPQQSGKCMNGFARPTLADLALFAGLSQAVENGFYTLAEFPRLNAWYAAIRLLPSTRRVYLSFYRTVRDYGLPYDARDLDEGRFSGPIIRAW